MKKTILVILVSLMIGCTSQPYSISSEEGFLTANLELSDEGELTINLIDEGKLAVRLNEGTLIVRFPRDDDHIISKSPISLNIDNSTAKWRLLGCKTSKSKSTLPMPYGEFSEVQVAYSEMLCDVELSTNTQVIGGTLAVRLFDDAMAYRVTLNDLPEGTTLKEASRWIPVDLSGECFATNGEHEPIGPLAISEATRLNRTPLIYKCDDYILAFHECDLENYPQLFISGDEDGNSLNINIEEVKLSGDVQLPWRTVMVGEDFEDLHNQKPIYQTMSREPEGDFSWVKPGLCMWDWRVKGTTFDGFTYEMNDESLKRYIDFCSRSNIAYFLIDAEWYELHDPLTPVETLTDIEEVISYGKERGVGVILYYDLKYVDADHPKIDFDIIAKRYSELGAAGMKYGFLSAKTYQAKTDLTYEIIKTTAKYNMIVDFHDSPIPFSGLERRFPNYVNREYCHAQLDRRAAFNPRQFVKMACINLLAGHMDQTNGTFALNEMATRSKGPKNEYNSTVSAEAARFLFTHTGSFSIMIDAPEAYSQKADLFEVISSMPKSWDETLYLDMEYDSHVAVAKRSGEEWFVSVVYGEKGGEYELELEFLDPYTKYSATIYRDTESTDHRTNKEAYEIEKQEVSSQDEITVRVVDGGGFSVILKKK